MCSWTLYEINIAHCSFNLPHFGPSLPATFTFTTLSLTDSQSLLFSVTQLKVCFFPYDLCQPTRSRFTPSLYITLHSFQLLHLQKISLSLIIRSVSLVHSVSLSFRSYMDRHLKTIQVTETYTGFKSVSCPFYRFERRIYFSFFCNFY